MSRNKTLYRCKLFFNGNTQNLACDIATLKQYISVLEIYLSFFKDRLEGPTNLMPIFFSNNSRPFRY